MILKPEIPATLKAISEAIGCEVLRWIPIPSEPGNGVYCDEEADDPLAEGSVRIADLDDPVVGSFLVAGEVDTRTGCIRPTTMSIEGFLAIMRWATYDPET